MTGSSGPEVIGLSTMTSAVGKADNYVKWILRLFRPYLGSRLLEVGTGQANFARHLRQGLTRFVSIDIDEKVVLSAREADPAGTYLRLDVVSPGFRASLRGNAFDTVLCVNVLEHVHDARQGFANMMDVLEPGGNLLLFVPAFPLLYGDLDRLAGHVRRYTRQDIAGLAAGVPEAVILRNEYFNAVGGVGWLFHRFIRHRDLDSAGLNAQVVLFDRLVVPLAMALNPLTRSVFGQSLLCVIHKKER